MNYTWSKFIDNQEARNELASVPGNAMRSPTTIIRKTGAVFPEMIFATGSSGVRFTNFPWPGKMDSPNPQTG